MSRVLVFVYVFTAVLTFGHSAAGQNAFYDANCATIDQRIETGSDCYFPSVPSAVVAGVLWPLYWSWTAFESAQ